MKATACPTGSEGGDEDVEVWRDRNVLIKMLEMDFNQVVIDDEYLTNVNAIVVEEMMKGFRVIK